MSYFGVGGWGEGRCGAFEDVEAFKEGCFSFPLEISFQFSLIDFLTFAFQFQGSECMFEDNEG
jgi:hypothetical protein